MRVGYGNVVYLFFDQEDDVLRRRCASWWWRADRIDRRTIDRRWLQGTPSGMGRTSWSTGSPEIVEYGLFERARELNEIVSRRRRAHG